MGRYTKALGIDRSDTTSNAELSPQGALTWAVSKSPAVLGGFLAQWAYDWGIKKWPKHPRGAEFVGGVTTVIVAYGLQVAVTKYSPQHGRMVDRLTDGMMGKVGAVVWRIVKGLFGIKDAKGGAKQAGNALQPCLDGDREGVREAAGLWANSPDTMQSMADEMFKVMRRDGVDINPEGQRAVVRAMNEVTGKMARGEFER